MALKPRRLIDGMTTKLPIAEQSKDRAWHSQSADEVLAQLGSAATGLSATVAAQRLAADGPNELQDASASAPGRSSSGSSIASSSEMSDGK